MSETGTATGQAHDGVGGPGVAGAHDSTCMDFCASTPSQPSPLPHPRDPWQHDVAPDEYIVYVHRTRPDPPTVPTTAVINTCSLTYYCGYCDAWVDYQKPCGHVSRCPVCQTTHFVQRNR